MKKQVLKKIIIIKTIEQKSSTFVLCGIVVSSTRVYTQLHNFKNKKDYIQHEPIFCFTEDFVVVEVVKC